MCLPAEILFCIIENVFSTLTILCQFARSTVEPRYLELACFELPLISKWKFGPCFNMKLWQQATK